VEQNQRKRKQKKSGLCKSSRDFISSEEKLEEKEEIIVKKPKFGVFQSIVSNNSVSKLIFEEMKK
jgi:hypothetical protein